MHILHFIILFNSVLQTLHHIWYEKVRHLSWFSQVIKLIILSFDGCNYDSSAEALFDLAEDDFLDQDFDLGLLPNEGLLVEKRAETDAIIEYVQSAWDWQSSPIEHTAVLLDQNCELRV